MLRLKSSSPLWDHNIIKTGGGNVDAAQDSIRGVRIAVKGNLFDDPRSITQEVLKTSFREDFGVYELPDAIQSALLLHPASPYHQLSLASDNGDNCDDLLKNMKNAKTVDSLYLVKMNEIISLSSITTTF